MPRKKRKKLSSEEIEARQHAREIRNSLINAGFIRINGVTDKEFEFDDKRGEIDDLYVTENIIVVAEYTSGKTSNVGTHLQKKKILFDKIQAKPAQFILFLEDKFPDFKSKREPVYDPTQCHIVIVYCSRHDIEASHKKAVPNIKYLDYPELKYFSGVTKAIRKSSRSELMHFFGLTYNQIGKRAIKPSTGNFDTYHGSILPEPNSKFDPGFKVVSFYMDPEALIERAYVLRKDGWQDKDGLYQRLIIRNKISKMRGYLSKEKRVFINNIIVTLPPDTQLLDEKDRIIDPANFSKTEAVVIKLPLGYNTIGLIDGQHRVFAYHEGSDKFETEIKKYRSQQNLLVTGVIYPENLSERERLRFEARLFQEINANQTAAKSDLKQAIELVLHPFSTISIAKSVIQKLSENGPLAGHLERHFFERDKIKTTSIVSYGLKPIIKLSGNDSFFEVWKKSNKKELLKGKDEDLLEEYREFCVAEINKFFIAVRKNIPNARWTTDRKSKGILTPTVINGLIRCLRQLVQEGRSGNEKYYEKLLANIDSYRFDKFKSSHWNKMGENIYETYFKGK